MKTTTEHTTNKECISQLCEKLKSLGYIVYLAESGTYGFFHRPNEDKHINFQIDYFFFQFSSNHKGNNIGTGHRLTSDEQCLLWEIDKFCTKDFCERLLNCAPYKSRRKNETFTRWSTVAEHLTFYSSSNYKLI